jgi:hypothetical protein
MKYCENGPAYDCNFRIHPRSGPFPSGLGRISRIVSAEGPQYPTS